MLALVLVAGTSAWSQHRSLSHCTQSCCTWADNTIWTGSLEGSWVTSMNSAISSQSAWDISLENNYGIGTECSSCFANAAVCISNHCGKAFESSNDAGLTCFIDLCLEALNKCTAFDPPATAVNPNVEYVLGAAEGLPIAAIVGGSLGGVALLCLGSYIAYILLKKKSTPGGKTTTSTASV